MALRCTAEALSAPAPAPSTTRAAGELPLGRTEHEPPTARGVRGTRRRGWPVPSRVRVRHRGFQRAVSPITAWQRSASRSSASLPRLSRNDRLSPTRTPEERVAEPAPSTPAGSTLTHTNPGRARYLVRGSPPRHQPRHHERRYDGNETTVRNHPKRTDIVPICEYRCLNSIRKTIRVFMLASDHDVRRIDYSSLWISNPI